MSRSRLAAFAERRNRVSVTILARTEKLREETRLKAPYAERRNRVSADDSGNNPKIWRRNPVSSPQRKEIEPMLYC
ncbi:MAG: hypothetical protein F6J93_38765 [Oscillatoria sp. SIO1A7]|nr:hypothetical protein [Oscillatoria sp. SIO1A7]